MFVGNLYHQPNALAVTTIRDTILPILRATGIDASVRIVGRGPAALTQPVAGIEFTGRVDTINDALRGATLALAPLTAGSGAKMKVLDYMAAGLPVVGTSEAVTGLPLGHSGVVVNDDLRAWPSLLAALLRDPIALREIGHGGRACIERELSWQQIGTNLVRQAEAWRTVPPSTPQLQTMSEDADIPRWLADHATQGALGEPARPRGLASRAGCVTAPTPPNQPGSPNGGPMTVRLLDLATCTCAVSAPDPVHDGMLSYVQPYLVPALDQPDVVVAVGCDATVVTQTTGQLASHTPTATRTSHPQQQYHAWTDGDQEALLPEHATNHVITTTGDYIFVTANHPKVATLDLVGETVAYALLTPSTALTSSSARSRRFGVSTH